MLTPDLDLLCAPDTASALTVVPAPMAPSPELWTLATRLAPAPRRAPESVGAGPARAARPDPAQHWLGTATGIRYPVLAGIPLLLSDYAHDAAGPLGATAGIPRRELDHYSAVSLRLAADVADDPTLAELRALATVAERSGTVLDETWVDAPYDGPAQLRCYEFLRPLVRGGTAVQIGGSGTHALKFLLAGAARAVIVSPVVGELLLADAFARALGLADRLLPVAGTGEGLPLAAGSVDVLYCGGTLHHLDTARAGRQFARVLTAAGRFAAAEPWKVPLLHTAGTRLLGKRGPVDCQPIDAARLGALRGGFAGWVDDRRHGAFTRYPALALGKAGLRLPARTLLRVMLREDELDLPGAALGSSISLTGCQAPSPLTAAAGLPHARATATRAADSTETAGDLPAVSVSGERGQR
ncbi:class I SAM-dependent methyltransferase [Pseudofrankia inefficax]|uniref:Methyltransferase type 11 n=1 Tax=Pseudofrankia inefficax (strain DSM 45817 / CECT 9037 / DDB 130130 / EuI1c) TaxID=298654 RepID=E3J297_PSEI1|nr:methyltransferase domain-containing protein [Pseudofrankia inefficax]ADP78135.1 Methyltransferase type 11 [Pseudofrankia inefficax]